MTEISKKAGELARAVRGLVRGKDIDGINIFPATIDNMSRHVEILDEYDNLIMEDLKN